MIQPMTGRIQSSCHQPLRSVSCRRRAPTANEGSNVASENNPETDRFWWVTTEMVILTRKMNSVYHQNSGRFARPLKSAYFAKQVLIESTKFMIAPIVIVMHGTSDRQKNHSTKAGYGAEIVGADSHPLPATSPELRVTNCRLPKHLFARL